MESVRMSPIASRSFKFSGRAPQDTDTRAVPGDSFAPIQVPIPGGHHVPQYAPTVVGGNNVYDPANDCDGNFMAYKFQTHNNCYNYACDVATNSFAQPGRKHGLLLTGANFTADTVVKGAEKDGLLEISEKPMSNAEMAEAKKSLPPGHFVALLFSAPDANVKWPGDYHWVRCDNDGTWSQKDGTNSVTNFDFAGRAMTDIASTNWTVNQGPMNEDSPNDVVVGYKFHSMMYVPDGKIDII